MKEKIELDINTDLSIPAKKAWQKPGVEIISQDIESGQAGIFQEATFAGLDPFSLYNS
ncbi:hypothetical protein [Mucilaginibacter jinjuensis]|uniref:Uncharacterized protein n=1 Tax=Mucilaginibacter jinjuensis TaxID=1176721 RepID=A0ABY7T482_9SPHI|nr:hypothetical protein [Mucilaginibacter jinjuensis]WCT11264.1 hypothetical protein PQO05_21215 [Mucilaginibacter jinjuensis]